MNTTSSAIWKSSLAAVERLPPCPEDLSEPQYVNLMFWGHCHVRIFALPIALLRFRFRSICVFSSVFLKIANCSNTWKLESSCAQSAARTSVYHFAGRPRKHAQLLTLFRFLLWDQLPGNIDERLKSLIPSIGEDLCKHEREVGYVLCDSYERKSKRKRVTPQASFFHVATAVKLNKEIKALRTEKLKKAWVEDRGIAWRKIKEVGRLCRGVCLH